MGSGSQAIKKGRVFYGEMGRREKRMKDNVKQLGGRHSK